MFQRKGTVERPRITAPMVDTMLRLAHRAPSPPPIGNFDRPLPPIRSERPVWDANHPGHEALAEEKRAGRSGQEKVGVS